VLGICLELGVLFVVPRNLPKIGFLSSHVTHLMCGNLLGMGPSISDDVHLNPIICVELVGSHIVRFTYTIPLDFA
jgi:hypothetical protein